MKVKARSYLDGFGAVSGILELDASTRQELVEWQDPQREDLLLRPWRRGYNAAIRRALGH